jgi:thiol-disulfide isomerase/thioredoxin
MLAYAVRTLRTSDPVVIKALIDFHVDNEKNGTLCLALGRMPSEGGARFVEAVYKKHPDKEIRGLALYSLAQMANTLFDAAEEPDAKLKAKTLAMWNKVIDEVGDQVVGKTTLGREAKNQIFLIEKLSVGCVAPDTTAEDLEGKKVKLSDYRGKVVALDIWATWCGPCIAMIPHEREMVERLKDKPFALISLSGDAKKETLEKFLAKTKMPWTHWWSGNQEGFIREWKVSFYPTIYILDAKGVIRYKGLRGEKMEEAVNKLLKEVN